MAHRSQPLHNFVLPSRLKWGNQRHLRCMKPNHLRSYIPESDSDQKKDLSFLYESLPVPDTKIQRNQAHVVEEEDDPGLCGTRKMPWNLRTRRSACKAPVNDKSKLPEKKHKKVDLSSTLSLRLMTQRSRDHVERSNFSVSLSPHEIKEDFLIMTGNNPSRRPKKRAKLLQKQFDILSPGFWLDEITLDTYRLPDEVVEIKK